MRELEADVGVQLAPVDLVEHPVVQVGAVLGLFGVGDVFPKVIDADAGAPAVDDLGLVYGIVQVRAGDKTLGKLHAQRRLLGEVAE